MANSYGCSSHEKPYSDPGCQKYINIEQLEESFREVYSKEQHNNIAIKCSEIMESPDHERIISKLVNNNSALVHSFLISCALYMKDKQKFNMLILDLKKHSREQQVIDIIDSFEYLVANDFNNISQRISCWLAYRGRGNVAQCFSEIGKEQVKRTYYSLFVAGFK